MSEIGTAVKRARRKRAAKAVKKFRTMIPSLRDYARKATGNPTLKLEPGKNSETDGKTIWIRPPLSLGNDNKHNGLCEQRAFGLSVCPECAAREELMAVLHHEIGHIVHGTFEKPNRTAVRSSAARLDMPYLQKDAIERAIYAHTDWPTVGYANASGNPNFSFVILSHEDIRCDEARMRYDPSEIEVFDAISEEILVNGVDLEDGSVRYYTEMPDDHQIMLAQMFAARGFTDLDGYFSDRVVEDVQRPEAQELQQLALDAPDVTATFDVCTKVYNYYRTLNYFQTDDLSDEQMEELFKALEELFAIILGHGISEMIESGTGEGVGRQSNQGNSLAAGAGGSEGDKDTEDMNTTIESLKLLDRVPVNVLAPRLHHGEGTAYERFRHDIEQNNFRSDERALIPALTAARIAFGVNARADRQRNQTSGRIDGPRLAQRVPFGDERMFRKTVRPTKRAYHVVIGLDISGSTSGSIITQGKMAVLAMADVCHRLGITFEIWAHTTESRDGDSWGADHPVFYQVKVAKENWTDQTKELLRTLGSSGGNLDGHTLQFYRKRVEMGRATDKIIMYYTDGSMPASNYDEELMVLKSEIEYCHKHGITLMAVGLGTDSPREHGFDTAVIEGEADYRKVVEHLGKRLR